jgi:hypothetical protein
MKNIITFKKEYTKFAVLTILSVITGIVEYIGFEKTNSNTLGIAITHMLFHVAFFGTLFIFSYFLYHKNTDQEEKIEKLISYGTIVLVIGLGIFRIHELFDHTFEQMIFGNMATLRWYLLLINALIFLQWYVLHAKTNNNSCDALCHGSEGHLLVDCIGFITLFWVTFTGSFITSIVDTILFILSGGILILTVIRIIKNLNKKYSKRVH